MKHLLLSASLLLIGGNLVAQLHVSPNTATNTDSFIYANDVVIYVEDDIDLVANNVNPETRASIYLRGDSQLIQGTTGTSTNSGNGSLSVWQRGFANAFDYNYWASPVGNPNFGPTTGNSRFGIPRIFDVQGDGSGNLHKTFSTQQVTTTALNGEAHILGDPTHTALRVSQRWIYTLRMGTQYIEWVHIANQNGNGNGLAAGEGFTMKGTGTTGIAEDAHDQLYDFRGRPNDGNITVAVGPEQVTLTGNPYPSALDMRAFLLDTDNDDIYAAAYFWDQNRETNTHYVYDYQGGYGTWIPQGGENIGDGTPSGVYTLPVFQYIDGYGTSIGGTGELGELKQRRFAPIGQGFTVRGEASLAPGTGTATYKNTMRRNVRQSGATYSEFRSATGTSATSGPVTLPAEPNYLYPTIRFHVEVDEAYVRDMVLTLSEETTKGNDRGWDGKHPALITAGDAFWVLENETDPYVIQARPFDYQELIPLGLRVKNGSNTFKIRAVEMNGFGNLSESQGAEIRIYLYDQLNNQYQRISSEHTAMINHNGNAGKIEDRYFIVYRRGILEPSPTLKNQMANVNFFQNNPQSKLEVSNPDVLDIKNASIYDMRGRLVLSENNIGEVARFSFPTHNLSSGVYIVKLTTAENGVIDYKITVHNR